MGKLILPLITAAIIIIAGNSFSNQVPQCANSISCKNPLVEKVENDASGTFLGQKVTPPKIDLAIGQKTTDVLGESVEPGEKRIYVDLSTQTVHAYQGKNKVMQAIISSGKWGRTPTGNFNIWSKFKATRMSGGSGSDYYDLPNVPWTMFYYRDWAIHGAYWHNNFGRPMSHGCVNMRQVDAEALFNWADGPQNGKKGTAVSVCDTFTGPDNCVQKNPIN